MMPQTPSTQTMRQRWLAAWHKLDAVQWQSLPEAALVDRILAALPPRQTDERLEHWFARAGGLHIGAAIPFARFRLQPLAEQELLAAKSQGQPLPAAPILFPDGDFRLTVSEQAGKLRLFLEALGLAIDTYQHCYIAIAHGRDLPSLLAVVRLDAEGEAEVWLEDSAELRAKLFQIELLQVIADDA